MFDQGFRPLPKGLAFFLSSGTALLLWPKASYVASIASRSHKAISPGRSSLTKRSRVVERSGENCWLHPLRPACSKSLFPCRARSMLVVNGLYSHAKDSIYGSQCYHRTGNWHHTYLTKM